MAEFTPNSSENVALPEPAYVKDIKLSGLGGTPPRRLAMINGKTLAEGESTIVRVAAREVPIRCVRIKERSALVTIGDMSETRELLLR